MRLFILALAAFTAAPLAAAEKPAPLRLVPAEGGGYAIEATGAAPVEATGIADAAALAPLLAATDGPDKVDYANGRKVDGVFTVTVGREDGTLGRYERATDIIVFAAPKSLNTVNNVTTLEGGVVFALKINNARAVQRFEKGVITLTATTKSL